MNEPPRRWFSTLVQIRQYAGEGAYGATFLDPVFDWARVDTARELVKSARGDEVVSERTLKFRPSAVEHLTPESEIEVDGITTRVLQVRRVHDMGGRTIFIQVSTT